MRSSSSAKTASGRSRIWIEIAVAVGAVAAGCSGPCKKIETTRAALVSRQAQPVERHAAVYIPLARANAVIARLVDRGVATGFELPESMRWMSRFLGTPSLVPARVELLPSKPGSLRLEVELEVHAVGQRLFAISAATEIEPRLERNDDGVFLEFQVPPEALAEVRPTVVAKDSAALVASLASRLAKKGVPAGARALAKKIVDELIEALQNERLAWARERVMERISRATRLRVRLPDVPVEDVAVEPRRNPDAIELLIRTSLPVRAGLAKDSRATIGKGADIAVRMSGSTAMELANWGIDHGVLPTEYSRTLKPEPGGKYRPILDWRGSDARRPMVVHIFQTRGGCSHFRIGTRPELSIEGDTLIANTRDSRLEAVDGSAALKVGAWIQTAVGRSLDRSRRAAAHTEIRVGDETLSLRITGVARAGNELVFSFRVEPDEASTGVTPPPSESSGSRSWGG